MFEMIHTMISIRIRNFIAVILTTIMTACLYGQSNTIEELMANTQSDNFVEVQSSLNQFYADNPTAPGYKQWKRYEWFVEPRLFPSGSFRNLTQSALNAYTRVKKDVTTRSTHGDWDFVGPSSWTAGPSGDAGMGRLNCIEIHPTNENIIYVGASNGGIWKTTNGGTSWTNVSPHIPLLSVADIEIDPTNPNRVYVLTGDGDPGPIETRAHGQTEISSIGIILSTNAGATWYPTNFTFNHPSTLVPIKLLMHPTDPDIQFVAAQNGIFKTTDGWDTNTQVISNVTFDIEFNPDKPSSMFSAGASVIRRSTDLGDTWSTVTDFDFSILSNAGRIELAVTPDDTNVVYALSGNWTGGLVGFYYSLDSGADDTWTLADSSTTTLGQFTQYCVALVAHPDNWIDVYGGMQWIHHSNVAGITGSWNNIVGTVHADIHDVAITSNALYVASDGGLHKSTDDGANWTDLSAGLAITEVYRIAGTPQNSGLYYCGTQDNGTLKSDNSTNFVTATGSDGMTCRINYNNSDTVYTGVQNGGFRKSTNGGISFSTFSVPGDASAWITPMIMDQVDPGVLFFGKDSIYRSDDGASTFTYLGMPSGSDINVLAQGVDNRNRLYASSASQIFRTTNAMAGIGPVSWTSIGGGVPNLFITDIVVDPDNALRLWVTLSGYSAGDKVYFSSNAGNSWTNVSGSLPNIPVNCIAYHNTSPNIDALYIGTDVGVFYRDVNQGDWIYFSTQMPAVNVSDLYVHPGDGLITAGTFGRGIWSSDLYTSCQSTVNVIDAGSQIGGVHWISAGTQINSDARYRLDIGTEVHYSAGQTVILNPGFRADGQIFFEADIGPCPPITSEPLAAQNPTGKWVAKKASKIIGTIE